MKINEIRIYAEVLEQEFDFKEYIIKSGFQGTIKNIYTKKVKEEIVFSDSIVNRIRKCKDVDVLITAISANNEYPLLMIEYSAAVPTDDHKMQRSDVYFWASLFQVPVMKISPSNKGMEQEFGGGNKFTNEYEQALAIKHNAIFYPITWEKSAAKNILKTKPDALSCICFSDEILTILGKIIDSFENTTDINFHYKKLLNDYKAENAGIIREFTDEKMKSYIVNSSRFHWIDNSRRKKLRSKINRFGHAMDPDRGVLYFTNMLLGADNCVTEIQVNRDADFDARGGYKALFDAASHEPALRKYVKDIIKNNNNKFTDDNALYILKKALNIEEWNLFESVGSVPHSYIIRDDVLVQFLKNHPSIVSKCIFYLSTSLVLTDVNRKTICEIAWNRKPIEDYLKTLATSNYEPVPITELTMPRVTEDIITFASVALYKKLQCDLLAVSYPGAQGDRCVLLGTGRKVKRTYIDIIAIKNTNSQVTVFLQENKDELTKSQADVEKLKNFVNDDEQIEGLRKFIYKTKSYSDFDSLKLSVGAKQPHISQSYDVDYIFTFTVNSGNGKTTVDYIVALVDTTLLPTFAPLRDSNGKLKGRLEFDMIYVIQ